MKKKNLELVPQVAPSTSDHVEKGAEPEPGDAISGTLRVNRPKKCCREYATHLQKRLAASEHDADKFKQAYRGLKSEFKRLREEAT